VKIARFRVPSRHGPGPDRSGVGVVTSSPGGGAKPLSTDRVELADLTGALDGVSLPMDVATLLLHGDRSLLESAISRVPRREVPSDHLEAPVPCPGKFLAIGYNYRAHAAEAGAEENGFPLFFNKQVTCVTGPRAPIQLPPGCEMLDYEGELALVVGRACRNVPAERAREVVGGWMVCNDVSARDWQRQSPTITMGKSHDGFGPLGPWLVTPDEIDDPHALSIRTMVNGDERQCGTTADMIHDVFEQIAVLSSRCTLLPGDVITTGSPAGSAQGRVPPPWLLRGDVVRVEVEAVGMLENRVVDGDRSPWIDPDPLDAFRARRAAVCGAVAEGRE